MEAIAFRVGVSVRCYLCVLRRRGGLRAVKADDECEQDREQRRFHSRHSLLRSEISIVGLFPGNDVD